MIPLKERINRIGRLRLFNHFLTLVAVGLGLYIIIAPLLPQANWWVTQETPLKRWTGNDQKVAAVAAQEVRDNRLFIPGLGLNQLIHEGGAEALRKGVVRRGNTSTPGSGSNTVLVGHRFGYNNDGVFYHLDKLKIGDPVVLHWEGERFEYTVTESFVVRADQVEIENPSQTELLTLYTCTPLWNPKDRLVIRAVPARIQEESR